MFFYTISPPRVFNAPTANTFFRARGGTAMIKHDDYIALGASRGTREHRKFPLCLRIATYSCACVNKILFGKRFIKKPREKFPGREKSLFVPASFVRFRRVRRCGALVYRSAYYYYYYYYYYHLLLASGNSFLLATRFGVGHSVQFRPQSPGAAFLLANRFGGGLYLLKL